MPNDGRPMVVKSFWFVGDGQMFKVGKIGNVGNNQFPLVSMNSFGVPHVHLIPRMDDHVLK